MDSENNETSEKLLQLPMSRIKKLVKLDPEVSMATQPAIFLIAKATELLIEAIARESYGYTAMENKKTVMKKHVEAAINNTDSLAFLDGALD